MGNTWRQSYKYNNPNNTDEMTRRNHKKRKIQLLLQSYTSKLGQEFNTTMFFVLFLLIKLGPFWNKFGSEVNNWVIIDRYKMFVLTSIYSGWKKKLSIYLGESLMSIIWCRKFQLVRVVTIFKNQTQTIDANALNKFHIEMFKN